MQKRRWPWLLGAVLLIACASFLMRVGEGEPQPRSTWNRIDIPRRATQEDKERMAQRQVLDPMLPPKVDAGVAPPPARPRDPVLAALGGKFDKGAVVIEANAVRNSPIGQLLVDCIDSAGEGGRLERLKERTGVDPLTQLDRVAVTDDMVVFSGDFKALKTDSFGATPTQFGDSAQLVQLLRPDGGPGGTLGTWGGQLIAVGDDPEQVKQTLERIEGKRPMEPGALNDSQAYGEIYGVLSPEALAELLAEENPELAERVGQVAQRVELHVDASGDVGVAARVEATNAEDAKEVSKALGAAMAMVRLQARSEGKNDIADLLDMGKVVSDGASFRLEAGIPQPWIESALKKCVERNKARRERRAEPSPPEASPTAPPR